MLKPSYNDVDQLKVFPFLSSDDLLDELFIYVAKANGVSQDVNNELVEEP